MSRLQKIQQMLEKTPGDVFLNFALGIELAKEGRIDEAVRQFDHTIQLDPAYTTAYFQKANTLLAAGRIPHARAAFEQGIEAAIRHNDLHAAEEMRAAMAAIP